MANHKKHDPPDLEEALEHVVYEIWKYKQSVAYYSQIHGASGDAALEFRVLHHRVLLDFFYGPPKHQDNIVAWEYISDWQVTHDGSKLEWLRDYMKRCHTMLAHISKTRSEMAKCGLKDWGHCWQTVEPHLDQTISEFFGGLSRDHQNTCVELIDRWSKGNYQGNSVLTGLSSIVSRP
jgi:hypothetical protein